jgi:hypothetical protein
MVHVYPADDMYEHNTENRLCWCQPRYDEEDNIVVHNSFDERESYETGARALH